MVDTGWFVVPGVNPTTGQELAGAILFDHALELALENWVFLTSEEA